MPIYVYGCDANRQHPRREVQHSMAASPEIRCRKCGSKMHRVPQRVDFYQNPFEILSARADREFAQYKNKRRRAR